jgi:hypothetical protein
MSSSNSQNYLSNVFRQVYTYDGSKFVPTLNMSNISKITADSLTVTTLSLGGTNDNLYFGDRAGSLNSNSRDNVAIGVEAANNISNTSNSVFLGRSAGAGVDGADTMISIGMSAKGNGTSNIYIGKDTGAAAASSSNIFIGHSLDISLAVSNTLIIGQDGDTLITGNFSDKWLGIGTPTPTSGYKFDVSGDTNIKGALNVTGNLNAGSLSVSAVSAPYSRLSNGTVSLPSYSFVNDTSMGMYMVASNTIGFAYEGQQSMCISGSRVGINTPTPRTALDVNGDISANRYNGPNGTASAPKYTFSSDLSTGLFLASDGALSFTAGGVKQLTITSNGLVNDNPGAVTTNAILRDYVTPINYDISGGNILVTKTVSASNFTGIGSASNSIGGVTLSNSNVSGVVTTTTSNVLANGYLRNALIPTQFDISGGNISNSATHTSSNFVTGTASSNNIGGVTLSNSNVSGVVTTTTSNVLANGYLRNALIPTQFDISGGNMSNSATHTASNFVTGTASSNSIGGVILSNSNVSGVVTATTSNVLANGYLRNALIPTQFDISGGNISNSGTTRSSNFVTGTASSNNIGGVALSNSNVSGVVSTTTSNVLANGYLRDALIPTQFDISGGNISNSGQLTASNIRVAAPFDPSVYATQEFGGGGNSSGAGGTPAIAFQRGSGIGGWRHFIRTRHVGSTPASNAIDFFTNIGGSTLESTAPGTGNTLAMSVTSGGVGIGTTPAFNLDVSGNARVTSNTTSSNFTTPTASSNSIGGVTLSNNNIAMSGTIIGSTANTSNQIGGVTLSNNNIAMSGTLIGSTVNTSNQIGGVTLSNNNIAMSGTLIGSTVNTSNQIGGVTLSNNNISNSGQLTTSNIRVGNAIDTNVYASEEFGGGADPDGTGTTPAARAAMAFQYRTAGFRHYIRSRHSGNANDAGNSIDFYLNASSSSNGSSAPGTGNVLAMNVTARGVGIGTTSVPRSSLHIQQTVSTDLSCVLTFQHFGPNAGFTQIRSDSIGPNGLGNAMSFWTRTDSGSDFDSNNLNVERMRINYNGVGIGTANPQYLLDVSSGTTNQGIRITAPNAQLNLVNTGVNAIMQMYNNGSAVGLYSTLAGPMVFSTNGTQKAMIDANGRVGIGNFAPGYLLDIDAGTTAASINMTSWPRMPSSCAMMALGSVNRTSSVMNWSNASISMNTELLTFVASNATNGSYFVIKKSGIWSIKCVVTNQDAAQYCSIDASTNIAFGGHIDSTGKLAQGHSSFIGDLTYVGYLSSNSGMYYKIIAPSGEQNSKNAKLLITFISEMPNISPTFPPP